MRTIDVMDGVQHPLSAVQDRIRGSALACGRDPAGVRLVGVTKTVPLEAVLAAIDAGLAICGENYIQEARDKLAALPPEYRGRADWHFIGRLQTNKAKYAVRLFDLIHSVDSVKLAREIDRQAAKIGKIQPILLQINVAGEATKAGAAPEAALSLAEATGRLDHVAVKGLMTMPPYFDAPEKARPCFRALGEIRDRIRAAALPGIGMDELSMGMTGDFEAAIAEGATLVRIGTAIFGARS